MKSYAYRAVHTNGRIHKGRMTAANENELAFLLREIALELIEAKDARSNTSFFRITTAGPLDKDRITLCSQLEAMLSSGLSFIDALTTITESMPQNSMRAILINVAQSVRSGQHVSRAFAENTALFDPVTLAILRTGETSGDLTDSFARITKHLKAEDKIRHELRRALRYPLFLLCVACAVTTFMMSFVVPQIITFLTSLDRDLPFMTRLLIGSAELFTTLWWMMPLTVLGSWLLLRFARSAYPEAIEITDRWLLSVPMLGPVLRKFALTRMTTSLSLLIKSGLTVPDALGISVTTLGNEALQSIARSAHRTLSEGRPLSSAVASLFLPSVLQILKVGEASGQIVKALEHIAHSYDREAQDSVDVLLGALEPALTLFVGGILAWIVLAVLGPVYGSLAPLSQGM